MQLDLGLTSVGILSTSVALTMIAFAQSTSVMMIGISFNNKTEYLKEFAVIQTVVFRPILRKKSNSLTSAGNVFENTKLKEFLMSYKQFTLALFLLWLCCNGNCFTHQQLMDSLTFSVLPMIFVSPQLLWLAC